MRLQLKNKLIVTFIFLSTWLCAANFSSIHFTIRDGLPSNAVYCVFKDSKGFIWIGTDAGLVKYDGFHFQTFTKKNGLVGNFIRDIKEDKNGNLWIACYGDGLSKFNGDRFINYSTKNGLIHNEIRCLYFDKKQNLFIGTERGLSVWNGKRFLNYLTKSFDKYNRFQIMQFWEENNKLFFLSRTHGYYQIHLKGNKLECDSLGKNFSQLIFMRLKNEKLYSFTDGFYKDKTNDLFPLHFEKHIKISNDVVWDYEKIGSNYFLASNCTFCDDGGLLIYNNGFLKNVSKHYNINSKQVWSLFFDKKDAKLWVSTLDMGFFIIDIKPRVSFFSFPEFMSLNENPICLISSKKELIWFNTNLKLTAHDFFEFVKRVNNRFLIPGKDSNKYNTNVISKLIDRPFELRAFQIHKNLLYVSTNIGFFELNTKGQFISYCPIETNLFKVRKSDFLICIPNGNFLILKKINEKWKFNFPRKKNENEPREINDLIHIKNKTYLSSALYGLFSIDDNSEYPILEKSSYLNGLKIKVICSDQRNILFVATNENEVLVFDIIDGKLVFNHKLDAHDFTGESILKIKYANKILLILTNRGLNLLKGNKHIFINEEQGLNLSNVTQAFIQNEKLIIGTIQGYYKVQFPAFFGFVKEKPIVSLKNLFVSGMTKNINSQRTINLGFKDNNLDLHLSKIKLYNAQKAELSYSLNKRNWSELLGNSINLRELATGNYQLYIRQKNLYSGNSLVYPLLKIHIAPPFWKTSWFLFIMLVFFVTFVYVIYQLNIKRIKAREQQKAELLKRITETKLEALQSQMNPHFIFNSLTSIHNYIIKSDVDNALLYMDKFSKLTRQTLEFSSRMHITLLEELEYLSHFISLENMRYGNQVEVTIDAGELDTLKILVPPLLIQPLIENSFEHGFTNREKNYRLELTFSIANNQLAIELCDDGEGFDADASKPESKAMNIIQERLLLLDPKLADSFSFTRANDKTFVRFILPLNIK